MQEFRQKKHWFVFQKFHLLPNLSVRENIIIPLIPENLSAKRLASVLRLACSILILHPKRIPQRDSLSGGEQQRVAIAETMINKPKIIIADEPTANLDTSLSQIFIHTMLKLKNEGKTIVIATHDPLFLIYIM